MRCAYIIHEDIFFKENLFQETTAKMLERVNFQKLDGWEFCDPQDDMEDIKRADFLNFFE